VPCWVRISSIASAFCFCNRIPSATKVSNTAERPLLLLPREAPSDVAVHDQ